MSNVRNSSPSHSDKEQLSEKRSVYPQRQLVLFSAISGLLLISNWIVTPTSSILNRKNASGNPNTQSYAVTDSPIIWFDNLDSALLAPDEPKYLYLRGRGWRELPEELLLFRNLQDADLSFNIIDTLPPWIGRLQTTKSLSFGQCHLHTVSDSICKLTMLEELVLIDNNITRLPECIGSLSNLRSLHLSLNPIVEFPESFYHLPSLNELGLVRQKKDPQIPDSIKQRIRAAYPNARIGF